MKKIKTIILCFLTIVLLFGLCSCKHEETPQERSERLQRELEEAQKKNREAHDAYDKLYGDLEGILP